MVNSWGLTEDKQVNNFSPKRDDMVYYFAVHVLLKAALLHRLSWCVGRCHILWHVWKELCWTGNTQEEHSAMPKHREKQKTHFFFLWKDRQFMVFAIMQPVLKNTPPESLALQVINLSAKLWQVYLNDLCGPTQSTQRAALTLQSSPLLTILCWVQRRWVSTEDSLLQCTLYSWKYNRKISEPQWLYA